MGVGALKPFHGVRSQVTLVSVRFVIRQRRRIVAACALGLYALLTLAAPLAHLARHTDDHTHALAPTIDWAAARSPATGRVDLERLARQLGLDTDARHAKAHRTGSRHDHGAKVPATSRTHGDGAIEHFGLALGSGKATFALVPALAPQARVATPEWPTRSFTPRLTFLDSQRAQAPPIG